MDAISRERLTFRYERLRSVAAGITETANTTFLGLVAIKYFDATQISKGVLNINTSLGLLLAPAVLSFVASRGWTAGKGAAILSAVAAVACAVAAVPNFALFLICSILAYMAAASVAPLYLSIYEANYRTQTRGKLFGKNYFLRIASNIVFGLAAGKLLDHDIHLFPIVLGAYALCFAFSTICVAKMPPVQLPAQASRHPLRSLSHAWTDRRFFWTLVSWMLLGYANLSMFPLRTEYLGNPDPNIGLGLNPLEISLYTSTVPNLARLCFNPIWGPLFDRMNFFKLRIILNTGFMLGFLSFFIGGSRDNTFGLALGAVLFGIANAGADVVWNLWVTKIAPEDKTAEYMAVHSFLTGVRGIVAPIVSFALTTRFPIKYIAVACASLVVLASLLLWREKNLVREGDTAKLGPEEGAG